MQKKSAHTFVWMCESVNLGPKIGLSFPKIGWQFLSYFPGLGCHFAKKVDIFLK